MGFLGAEGRLGRGPGSIRTRPEASGRCPPSSPAHDAGSSKPFDPWVFILDEKL
jgi:hypothetical protein